jgi:sugar lactone lactonase YvrE
MQVGSWPPAMAAPRPYEIAPGSPYRLDGRTVGIMLTGVGLPDGLGWDPSGMVVYSIDGPTQEALAPVTGPPGLRPAMTSLIRYAPPGSAAVTGPPATASGLR